MSPSRRDDIRMSELDVDAFIHAQWSMVLGTIGPDGRPHLATVGYGFLDGALAFSSFGRAQKMVNIGRDPRVNCLIEINQDDYDNIVGVNILGRAEVVDTPGAVSAIARSVLEQRVIYRGEAVTNEVEERHLAAASALATKRVPVVIRPERVISWDHRQLRGVY